MRARPFLIAGLFLLPNLLGFLAFTLLPVGASLGLSFCKWDPVAQEVTEIEPVGLDNYRELLALRFGSKAKKEGLLVANAPEFWDALGNTGFMMLAIPFSMAGSLLLAVLLNKSVRGLVVFRTAFFLPSICAGVGTMLLWTWMFDKEGGTVNQVLGQIGLAVNGVLGWFGIQGPNWEWPDWLNSYTWAKPALMIMGTWASVGGINMILYLSGLQNIPRDLYEAAAIDGAGKWQQLWHVTIPMLTPITFFVLIISVIGGLQGNFEGPYIMTGGANGTTTMSLYIYRQAFEFFRMGYASAIAWVLFLIVLTITLINWRIGERRVEY